MNIENIEEVYRIIKYSFNKNDVVTEADAFNIALSFFYKYHAGMAVRQEYVEFDVIEQKYHVYIAY